MFRATLCVLLLGSGCRTQVCSRSVLEAGVDEEIEGVRATESFPLPEVEPVVAHLLYTPPSPGCIHHYTTPAGPRVALVVLGEDERPRVQVLKLRPGVTEPPRAWAQDFTDDLRPELMVEQRYQVAERPHLRLEVYGISRDGDLARQAAVDVAGDRPPRLARLEWDRPGGRSGEARVIPQRDSCTVDRPRPDFGPFTRCTPRLIIEVDGVERHWVGFGLEAEETR